MAAGELEGGALFDAAVSAVLRGWPALKMAVTHRFGGPQSQAKATWMESATSQWMRENVDIQCDELELFLETLLDQEFDTIVDDESTPEVCHKICDLYRSCCSGNEESVRTFLAAHLPSPPLPPSGPTDMVEECQMEGRGESGGCEVEMEGGEEEDEGGWEVVRKNRRRSRK